VQNRWESKIDHSIPNGLPLTAGWNTQWKGMLLSALLVTTLTQKEVKMKMCLQKNGFSDWKHASGKNKAGILEGHAKCLTHT